MVTSWFGRFVPSAVEIIMVRPGMDVHRFGLEWYEQAYQTDGCH